MTTSDTTPPSSGSINIAPLNFTDDLQLHEASEVLFNALLPVTSALPTREAALGELLDLGREDTCITLGAFAPSAALIGIISASAHITGEVARLRTLAVDEGARHQGTGRALMANLEKALLESGYHTLSVGFGDEAGRTTLAGMDLYPDPLERLAGLQFPSDHPLRFFRSIGFSVVGVLPDAHGTGSHQIDLAKQIGPYPQG